MGSLVSHTLDPALLDPARATRSHSGTQAQATGTTDGRWTLAFVDEESSKAALEIIEEQGAVLRALISNALDDFVSLPDAWKRRHAPEAAANAPK